MLKEFTELGNREGEGAQGVKRFGGFKPLGDNGEACTNHTQLGAISLLLHGLGQDS